MVNTTGTKRRRDEPEPTAGGASGGTAAALPVVSQMIFAATLSAIAGVLATKTDSENEDDGSGRRVMLPPDEVDPVLMRQIRTTRLTKNLIMVSEIRRLCADRTADPAATLSAIADVLATKTDSEDEDDGSGRRVMLPPDEVVGCDQQ